MPDLRAVTVLIHLSPTTCQRPPQTSTNSRKSKRDNKLNFPILNDKDSEVADEFGIRFLLHDDLIEVYRKFGNDLPQINSGRDWRLPIGDDALNIDVNLAIEGGDVCALIANQSGDEDAAELTRMSSRPKAACTFLTRDTTSPGKAWSALKAIALPPAASISFTRFSARSVDAA
nr:peroxiredoxin family protein [Rhizobium sp. 3T7]